MLNAGPAPDWMAALRTTVDSITSVSLRDAWMQAEFDRELMHIADEGTGANEVHISLADVRSLLEFRLDGRPTRSNFRTGTLTVCTLTPMRSVPHRVVASTLSNTSPGPGRGSGRCCSSIRPADRQAKPHAAGLR